MAQGRSQQIPSLDGLRALAIGIVVWGHAGLPQYIVGSTGVTIFFFLSGYLITTLLRREAERTGTISIRDFYLRRTFRILPPLYVVLVAAIVMSLVDVLPDRMSGWGVTSAATFWQNYYLIGSGREGIPAGMNALWSLAVEEHFYLVLPVLYLVLRRTRLRRLGQAGVLAGICVAILVWRTWLVTHGAGYDRVYLATDTRADAILWGSVLALAWNPVLDMRPPRRNWPWTLVAVASFAAFWGISELPESVVMSVGYTGQSLCLVGVFVAVVLAPRSLPGLVLNWRPLAYIGVLSYSLYLVHRPVLMVVEQYVHAPKVVELLLAGVLMLGAALLLRVAVEKPFEKARRRFRQGAAAPAVTAGDAPTAATVGAGGPGGGASVPEQRTPVPGQRTSTSVPVQRSSVPGQRSSSGGAVEAAGPTDPVAGSSGTARSGSGTPV
ncbi:acyltransferase family protein [Nakamurella sp. YIM 132087]|uniref:Acyltransferase family protein n=1 Tax=Nakamurella alba TaxID=2665158 RepID=A0A7K1FNV7_9ACTN|nr:acyltransferase [Nakamurella alba]MTD15828.1 acyltransferase family protein [Nakamurella alba]